MTTVRNWKMQWVASDWHVPRESVNLNAPLATLACGSTRCLALLVRVCGILYLGQSSYAVASMPPPIGTDMSRVVESGDWYTPALEGGTPWAAVRAGPVQFCEIYIHIQ